MKQQRSQQQGQTAQGETSLMDNLMNFGSNEMRQQLMESGQNGLVNGLNALNNARATAGSYLDKGTSMLGDAAGWASDALFGADTKVGTVELHAYIDVPNLTYEDLAVDGNVGHTWIEYKPLDGGPTESWGFWPSGAYSADLMDSYVGGEVRHPDPHQGDSGATRKAEVTQDQRDSMQRYIDSKRAAKYSVFFYNCTDFGVEAYAAAGQSAPSSGSLGVDYPNALYEGIKKRNKRDGLDVAGDPVAPTTP